MRSFWILGLALAGGCMVAVDVNDKTGGEGGTDTATTSTDETPTGSTDAGTGQLDDGDGDPCTVTLPADTSVVTGSQSATAAYGVIWACAGADLSSTGAYAVIVAESGATVSATGAYDLVYVHAGANVTATGAYTEASAESDPDVTLTGTGAVLHSCPTITVDASAVQSGC